MELVFSKEGGADEANETKEIEAERIAVGTRIFAFVVEFVESEGEDGL